MHDSYKCVSLDRRIPFFYQPSQYILDNIDNKDFQPTDKLEAGKILPGMANTQIKLELTYYGTIQLLRRLSSTACGRKDAVYQLFDEQDG